ncbi:MAG: metallophosphoesterase [Nitrososphaerales archaeon]|nr:metallophosphoesterase [Nitrososphaerales archaeon]
MLNIVQNEPALILKTNVEKILLISDLHLGFERELYTHGFNIPSQIEKIYDKLKKILDAQEPNRLIILGDVKHGMSKILPHEWSDLPNFFERLLTCVDKIDIIPGNHDGGLKTLLPSRVNLHTPKGLMLKSGKRAVYLIHGHSWPYPEAFGADILIMGHHHFVVEMVEDSGLRLIEPVWLVTRWDSSKIIAHFLKSKRLKVKEDPIDFFKRSFRITPKNSRIVVMPTFNPLLKGMAVNREADTRYLGPIFRSSAIDIEKSELYLLDGTYLGYLSNLKHLS